MSVDTAKKLLRQKVLRQRNGLTLARQEAAAVAVALMLEELLGQIFAAKTGQLLHVAAYAAMRKELDLVACWPLLQNWPATLYFPAVRGGRLLLGRLPDQQKPDEFLKPQVFAIPEPPDQALLKEPARLDLVLVPGLAFSPDGGRVGWGKAYYDGLLTSLPGRPWLVGVGYDFQVFSAVPQAEHDVRLNAILTPTRLVWCARETG